MPIIKISMINGGMTMPLCEVFCEPKKSVSKADDLPDRLFFAAMRRVYENEAPYFKTFGLAHQWLIQDENGHSARMDEVRRGEVGDLEIPSVRKCGMRKAIYTRCGAQT